MRSFWTVVMCLATAAAFVSSAAARVQVSSGDTCTFSANGTTYTVNIVAANGVAQYGFAFGAPGLTLTNVGISGQNGNFTTTNLPANTGGAWMSDAPLNGNVVATLTGNGSSSGPVVVVPSGPSQSWFDAVTCAPAKANSSLTATTLAFSVAPRTAYSAAAHGWHLVVTVPVAGTVSAKQPLATSIKVRPKPLVQVKRQSLNSRGKVTLLVKATPQGQSMLDAKGTLRVRLTINFDSRDGREAHKLISLTLRR